MPITAPDFAIRSIRWAFSRGDNRLFSGWTGAGTIVAAPWSGRFTAHVELATIQGESNIAAIKSFIARCKGKTQSFRLFATAGAQNANSGVTLSSGAAAGDTSIDIAGETTSLTDGQMVTVNGQLLCLTEDQSGSTLTFQPPLRQAASAGTTVVTSRPYALVHMASSSNGWKVSPGRLLGVSFDVEEAVNEADVAVPESFNVLLETGDDLLLEDGSLMLME